MTSSGVRRIAEVDTTRLILRPWTQRYTDDFARLCSDSRVMKYISGGKPLDYAKAAAISQRGAELWRRHGFGPWAATEKSSGEWVGRIGLNLLEDWADPHKWEVGWELLEQFWGRGYATEGGRAAVDFGFGVALLPKIISVTVPGNLASRRVMEKVGLRYQGTLTYRGTDVVWYAADNPKPSTDCA